MTFLTNFCKEILYTLRDPHWHSLAPKHPLVDWRLRDGCLVIHFAFGVGGVALSTRVVLAHQRAFGTSKRLNYVRSRIRNGGDGARSQHPGLMTMGHDGRSRDYAIRDAQLCQDATATRTLPATLIAS